MKTHQKSNSRSYNAWRSMLSRCRRPKDKSYSYYGGRGIKVCERWLKFENFYLDMGEKPEGKELDRIDNNGNYEPANCRWTSHAINMRNRRKMENTINTHKGVYYYKRTNKWTAQIVINYKKYNLGYFSTQEEAIDAYQKEFDKLEK